MTSRFGIPTGVVVLALLLGACGGSTSAGGEATPPPAAGSEAAAGGGEGGSTAITFVTPAAVLAAKEEVATYAVAQEMGYFEEEGLEVTLQTSDGSTAALQAVASGSAQVTAADAGSILAARQQGVPVTGIGALVVNWPWQIGVPPGSDIAAPEDLAGKRVGIISLASGSNPFARAYVEAAGLDPDADVELIPVGVGPPAAAALDAGEVDALALYGQAYAVLENSGVELEYLENPELFESLVSLTWATTDSQLQEDPEVLGRFLRASYKGLLFSSANPEAAMRMGYEAIPELVAEGGSAEDQIEADVASLEAWLESVAPEEGEPSGWGDWGQLTDEQWTTVEQYTIDAGQLEAEVPIDEVWNPGQLEFANDWDRAPVLEAAEQPSEEGS